AARALSPYGCGEAVVAGGVAAGRNGARAQAPGRRLRRARGGDCRAAQYRAQSRSVRPEARARPRATAAALESPTKPARAASRASQAPARRCRPVLRIRVSFRG